MTTGSIIVIVLRRMGNDKYRIISDIHTELWPENFHKAERMVDALIPPLPDDQDCTLLLAGDIGSHRRQNVYRAVIEYLCKRFPTVIDIPGNHHWYGGTPLNVVEPCSDAENYHFDEMLGHGSVTAATLWTDFQRGNPVVEQQCFAGMNDYRQIPGLLPCHLAEKHRTHVAFLERTIVPGGVVMTHHAPSWRSIPERYRTDPINGAYASDLEWLIEEKKPAIWIHGHIHSRSDYMVGETRVICNPAGYDGADHDPRLIVEV